jgi:SWI/SNF-related matrix-associated actin-dependent regulator of chromatin subfamily A member 5
MAWFFLQFVKGCEKFGRKDLANVATEVDTKTPDEVAAYSKVFWQRYEELTNSEQGVWCLVC